VLEKPNRSSFEFTCTCTGEKPHAQAASRSSPPHLLLQLGVELDSVRALRQQVVGQVPTVGLVLWRLIAMDGDGAVEANSKVQYIYIYIYMYVYNSGLFVRVDK
jgi:hypothetical protein